jgi:hypothetical protein
MRIGSGALKKVQRRKRKWIKFADIAEGYSERGGPAGLKKAAVSQACKMRSTAATASTGISRPGYN